MCNLRSSVSCGVNGTEVVAQVVQQVPRHPDATSGGVTRPPALVTGRRLESSHSEAWSWSLSLSVCGCSRKERTAAVLSLPLPPLSLALSE